MSVFEPQVLNYIAPENIPKYLNNLHAGMSLSHCTHSSLVPGFINDLEWNFFDEPHRQYVHNTYDDMYKVIAGKYFSVNIVKWKNLPIFFQVANAKITDGLLYQSMNVLGILCVHQVVRLTQQEPHNVMIQVDWWTASHWIFKWLHRPFNKKLMFLQRKQDLEDNVAIRGRRLDLRLRGFAFATDKPDFINSNTLTNKVKLPLPDEPIVISLRDYAKNEVHRFKSEAIELLFKLVDDGVEVWPGICPHEGAQLDKSHLCKEVAVCPWHGRTFPKVMLNVEKNIWRFLNADVSFIDDKLVIRQVIKDKVKSTNSTTHSQHVHLY